MIATASLKVDAEFAGLCPELTTEELSLLESSIEADGIRDPVCAWQGLIIDGHNRHRIAKTLRIDCPSSEMEFADRAAVVEWIIANQLGRRNLTDEQKSYLRGKRYHAEKKREGRNGKRKELRQNEEARGETRHILAKQYGVGVSTIERDAKFSKAVDAIAEKDGHLAKQKILSGKSPLTRREIAEGKTEADAKPVTLRSALKKQRAQEKRIHSTSGSVSGAISQQPNEQVATPKQKKLIELFEAIKRIAVTTDSILTRKDEWAAAVEKEHWTAHTKTTIRNKLSGVETDFRKIHNILK